MTKEDRQLLLKDLAARFPYGVVLDVDTTDWRAPQGHIQVKIESYGIIFKDLSLIVNGSYYGDNYKPYLRPISSMTDEEFAEYEKAKDLDTLDSSETLIKNMKAKHRVRISKWYHGTDWLNAHHFDYRGLIERGLALEASEEMY